ncbi:DNA polymerase III epsilon subunit-like protein [Streptomyces sp. V4I8]|uniref:3'-5' exonuclease n=1 Tax=Streptomyces sp. V4I8 TaxID=3156469 RepID=UPI0035169F6A
MTFAEPTDLQDLFTRDVDEHAVQFVRPAGTNRTIWAAYANRQYQGTVSAEYHEGQAPLWRVLATQEEYASLDDAIRALRRPASWAREREQVARWARDLLADDSLLVVDVRTARPGNACAMQITAVDRRGALIFDEYVRPAAIVDPAVLAMHDIAPEHIAQAPAFGELLPALSDVLLNRRLVSYDADFHRAVFEHELIGCHGHFAAAQEWLDRLRWEDAMVPRAVWRGLWSAKYGTYCREPLSGLHSTAETCRLLLAALEEMGADARVNLW